MGVGNEPRIGKHLLPLLTAIPVLIGLAVTAYYVRADAAASRSQVLNDQIIRDARDIAALVQPTIDQTRQLAQLILQARAAGTDRDIIKGLAVPTLDLRREFLGIGVVFEPNGFDGRDADYAGKYPENDARGRFAAYYYRQSGKPVDTAPLDMAELGNTEAWYQVPLKTGHAALTLPFLYPLDGVEVPLSTVAAPMHEAGKPVGVTLIDFVMTDIAAKVEALTSADISGAWIVSSDGHWIVHPDKAKIGAGLALYDAGPEGDIEALRRDGGGVRAGPPQTREGLNGATYLMVPIPFDGVEQSWLLVVSVPKIGFWDGMPQDTTQALAAVAAILLVGLMVTVKLWMSTRRKQQPVAGASRHRTAATPRNSSAKLPVARSRREPTVRRR